jgi:hypothetical protein
VGNVIVVVVVEPFVGNDDDSTNVDAVVGTVISCAMALFRSVAFGSSSLLHSGVGDISISVTTITTVSASAIGILSWCMCVCVCVTVIVPFQFNNSFSNATLAIYVYQMIVQTSQLLR